MLGSSDRIGLEHFPTPVAQSTQVENTEKYEGKDNAPAGYFGSGRQKKKKDEKKKKRPSGEHKIDLVA
ncbi:hypothetical protein GF373_13735 [bacterium]|nr:hypothetical protein [bacterium]